MIVLTNTRLPDNLPPILRTGGPTDPDDRETERRMNYIKREFADIQKRLSSLLGYIEADTMAPMDPPDRRARP